MKNSAPTAIAKFLRILAKSAIVLTVLSSFGGLSTAQAGFLDLLRGEPSATEPSFQRVAFVGSALVKEVEGQADVLAGIDTWKSLKKGAELKPGDLVRTRKGTVLLRMKESGSFVKVTPQTMLRLMELETHWDRGSLSGSEEKEGFAVRSCRGSALVCEPGKDWRTIEVNAVLAIGSEIRTGPETVVDLFHTAERRPIRIRGPVVVKLQEGAFASKKVVEPSLIAGVGR
jgi:hypothetical protein